MKRFFILASAAIVALASCAKTQVVYNDAPEEIALKTVNMPMTKAATAYTQDLGVVAYKLDKTSYFTLTKFTGSDGVYTGGQYWPISTPLAFVAYGPYAAADVVVTPTGIVAENVESDVDLVYSGYVDNSGAGFGKGSNVPMTLYHTKAKIVVNVNVVGGNETVTKIELLGAPDGGNCTVEFPNTVTWAGQGTKTFEFAAVAPNNVHYVVPGTPTTLKITYNSAVPAQTGLETEVDLSTKTMYNEEGDEVAGGWQAGYSYTYNVTIESALITIEATEEPWIELSDVDPNE